MKWLGLMLAWFVVSFLIAFVREAWRDRQWWVDLYRDWKEWR